MAHFIVCGRKYIPSFFWTVSSILIFLSFSCPYYIFSQVPDNKSGGICFRFDDNLPIDKLRQVTAIFNKYGYKYCLALNLDALPDTLEYLDFIRQLDRTGFEIMDHCPNHGTQAFWSEQYCAYASHPGVDHLNGNMVCLKYEAIDISDTLLVLSNGCADIAGDTVISCVSGGFKDWNANSDVYFPLLQKFANPYVIKNHNPDDPDTFQVRSFWGEQANFGNLMKQEFFVVNVQSVRMTEMARSALAEESLSLFERYGLQRPSTWVQTGGKNPIFTPAEIKITFADKFNYTSGATSGGLLCYNDANKNARYAMQWGSFSGGEHVGASDKDIIVDRIAKHYLLIGGSHFLDISIDWPLYLSRVDSLLSWCQQKHIPVRTYREWANLIYDTPQNPYSDVFPKLTIDLDENGIPDGYELTGSTLDKADAPDPSGYCLSINKKGSICKINGLAGLEKGENEFSIWTKGSPGNFITLTILLQESGSSLSFKIPAEKTKWTRYVLSELKSNKQKLNIPENYSYFHFEFSCSEYRSGDVKISGMELRKKLDSPLYVLSSPDTLAYFNKKYEYRVIAAKYHLKDKLAFELVHAPSWLSIDSFGLISGTGSATEQHFPVLVRVKDQSGHVAEQSFNIRIKETPPVTVSAKTVCEVHKPIRYKRILAIVLGIISLALAFYFWKKRRVK